MYLLVDWYTLYMGVDRDRGIFVSLYGSGTFNGCHMGKEKERNWGKEADEKRELCKVPVLSLIKRSENKKKWIYWKKELTLNILFSYISMYIHLNSVLK